MACVMGERWRIRWRCSGSPWVWLQWAPGVASKGGDKLSAAGLKEKEYIEQQRRRTAEQQGRTFRAYEQDEDGNFKCPYCSTTMDNLMSMTFHIRVHNKKS